MNPPPGIEIALTLEPDPDDAQRLEQGLRAFETDHFPGLPDPSCDRRFHVFARDRDGGLAGGLRGAVYWDGLDVEVLWVSPDARGRGIGSALLESAEAFARRHDAVISHLKTVLAREFYERHGYHVYGVLEDRPVGSELLHMKKRLRATPGRAAGPDAEAAADADAHVTGSCLCGGVRFELRGPLRPIIACHCRQCRKSSGHFTAATAVRPEDFHLIEDTTLRWYCASAEAERGFCGRCGSTLFWKPHGGDRISVYAGSLDSDPGVRIEAHIFTDDRGAYYDIPARDGVTMHPHGGATLTMPDTPS